MVRHRAGISRNKLTRELRRVAKKVEGSPTTDDMREFGEFSVNTYYSAFDSWNGALESAGLERGTEINIPERELIDELHRVAEEYGRSPSVSEMDKESDYSGGVYRKRFGSWNSALEQAGLEPRRATNAVRGVRDYGEGWEENKEKALSRDGYECQDCGLSNDTHLELFDSSLHVHHKVPARCFDDAEERNAIENLVTLCVSCHSKRERGLENLSV